MAEFVPLQKGEENWHGKYNKDFAEVHAQLSNKASLKQPEIYDLVLEDDLQNYNLTSYYWKNTLNEVHLGLTVATKSVDSFENGRVLAKLPEGFRPDRTYAFPASGGPEGERLACVVCVTPEGKVLYWGTTVTDSLISFATFFAV